MVDQPVYGASPITSGGASPSIGSAPTVTSTVSAAGKSEGASAISANGISLKPPVITGSPEGTVTASIKAPAAAEVKAQGFWAEKVAGRVNGHGGGIKGMGGAAKQSFKEIGHGLNPVSGATLGERGVAFGRVGAIGVGAYVASGALQSKNADGTDRGALHRLGNLVVGGTMMAGGALAGRA